jgi:cold shock CspA family protein
MDNAFRKFFNRTPEEAVGENVEPRPEERRVVGKIIKISDEGWGFISSKEIKFTRIFFHWTSLRQDTLKFTELENKMVVEFTPIEVEGKGTRAIKIKVVEEVPESEEIELAE